MSDTKKQPEQGQRTSPLANSALFQNNEQTTPVQSLPALPSSKPEPPKEDPPVQKEEVKEELPPLLYLAEPSAEYIARPFDRKYDKQAMNASPYLMGAVEAVGKILKLSKTEMYEEMMRDFLVKHQEILEMRPDSVRLQEKKYREKHNL